MSAELKALLATARNVLKYRALQCLSDEKGRDHTFHAYTALLEACRTTASGIKEVRDEVLMVVDDATMTTKLFSPRSEARKYTDRDP